jgi:hypothetical protein
MKGGFGMAFWLVYQGTSFERARKGGYLWAPKVGKNGQTPVHWSNMERVRPGDLIFSAFNGALRAVSEPSLPAYTAERPDSRDDQYWDGDGWRLDVAYTDLPSPMPYADWVPAVLGEMPARHSPFTNVGRPNQGYLYEIPASVGEYIARLSREQGVDLEEAARLAAPPPAGGETERQQLARARIGQGKFRKDLMQVWSSRCAVSPVERAELLRASHIKPWSSSNNKERLDPSNGLLLSAAYDAAFDALLISFEDNGVITYAADFAPAAAAAAGIDPAARLGKLSDATKAYLAEHRALVAARVSRLT